MIEETNKGRMHEVSKLLLLSKMHKKDHRKDRRGSRSTDAGDAHTVLPVVAITMAIALTGLTFVSLQLSKKG